MDPLSPDIARKLLSRDLANLAQRIQRGEKLSKAERVMLQNMAAKAGETPAVAGDFSELARILQISRRTMNRWRKHPDAPPPGANGFEEVKPWQDFKERNNLKGDAPATPLEESLKARKMLAEVEERELRLGVKKREYVGYDEVREVWNRNSTKAKDLLRNKFEMELPPILSGLDAVAIQEECRKAIDEVLTIMCTDAGGVKGPEPK